MVSAQNKLYIKLATPIMGVAFLILSTSVVKATTAQVCYASEDCTVGEFLYDDSYTADTGATCTLNSKYPNGSSYISSQNLSSTADGWYGHTFTTSSTEGYYRSEICCDSGGDHLCIDKSFDVKSVSTSGGSGPSANDIAEAVWSYSDKTLTGFNNIVSDIWGFATRTITSGANINASVSSTEINTIKETANETRLLLEQLVNKPVVSNSFEEFEDFDLQGKIKDGQKVSEELYISILLAQSTIDKVTKSWNKLGSNEIVVGINDVKDLLGEESDSSSSDTLFGKVNFLRDSFGYKEADLIYEDIQAVKDSLNFTQTTLVVNGLKSTTLLKEFSSGSAYLKSSEKSLVIINKRLKESEGLSSLIDNNLSEAKKVLGMWSEMSGEEKNNLIEGLTKSTMSLNRVPKVSSVLSNVYENIVGDKKLKNKLLSVRGILFANKKLLLAGQKEVMLTNWLEEGSLVIKTLITNPSTLISQDVPLKYYLPKELKKEDVIETDAGVEVKYDTDQDQLYVEGTFTLKPAETKTIKVRVDDVWIISEGEIDSLKAQSDSLIKPLEKTPYYAQGITLKSDIDISLEKARDLVNDGVTPESKIKSYREAQLEIVGASEKLEKLKDMVSLASSSGSILGFVGGSQAIAVWGIVIAIASGFVFMTVYMRKLLGKETAKAKVIAHKANSFDKMAVFLVVATISGLLSSISVKKFVIPTVDAKTKSEVLGSTIVDYKQLKVVELISLDVVVKLYQDEGTDAVLELADSGKSVVEVERGEKRVRVVYEGKEVWVGVENVLER